MPPTMCLHVSLSSPPSARVFHPDITVMADWASKDNFHSILSVCLFVCLCLSLSLSLHPNRNLFSKEHVPKARNLPYPQNQERTQLPKPATYPIPEARNVLYTQSQQRTLKSWPLTPKARNLLESQDLTPPPPPQTDNLLPKPATYPQSQQLTSEATNLPQRQDITRKASNLPSKPGTYPQSQ